MKYTKSFEIVNGFEDLNTISELSESYQKYIEKFVIIDFKDNFYLAKFIGISYPGYYVRIDNYEWMPKGHEWHIERVDGLHLEDIKILFDSDTLEEAEEQYEILLDSNKYNV